jgi:ribonuclease T2
MRLVGLRALRCLRWLGCIALAAALAAANAPTQARQGNAPSQPGDFDYFLLSLSVAPSFCALSAANQAKAECQSLTTGDFHETPLTVHGLWPNRAGVSVNRQPQDCAAPPLGVLPLRLQYSLRRFMPAGPGLARYEWRKHGACSGLSPEAYFTALVQLAQHANDTIGDVMREEMMLGRTVRIADLLGAVGGRDAALAPAIVVDCRSPRGGGPALIDEIRVTLSKQFLPIPAQSVGLGQNSGCPQGAGFLPNGPD